MKCSWCIVGAFCSLHQYEHIYVTLIVSYFVQMICTRYCSIFCLYDTCVNAPQAITTRWWNTLSSLNNLQDIVVLLTSIPVTGSRATFSPGVHITVFLVCAHYNK